MRLLCVAVSLVVAAPAVAEDWMTLGVETSKTGTDGSWQSETTVDPGASVFVRFIIAFNRDAGWDAWGACTLTQLDVSGTDAGDTVSGFAGKLQPSTQTFTLWDPGTATAKLDRLDKPAGSIQLAQLPTSNGGSKDDPIVVLSYQYNVAATPGQRDIVASAPKSYITLFSVFTDSGGASWIWGPNRAVIPGTIHVAPAPASLALLVACIPRRRA